MTKLTLDWDLTTLYKTEEEVLEDFEKVKATALKKLSRFAALGSGFATFGIIGVINLIIRLILLAANQTTQHKAECQKQN